MVFLVVVQSLAFWLGTGGVFTSMAINAIVPFAIYPITIFNQTVKVILFMNVSAVFMGAVPPGFVKGFSWSALGLMLLGAAGFLIFAVLVLNSGYTAMKAATPSRLRSDGVK